MSDDRSAPLPVPAQVNALFAAGAYASLSSLASRYRQCVLKAVDLDAAEKVAVACAIVGDPIAARRLLEHMLAVPTPQPGTLINLAVLDLEAGAYEFAKRRLEQAAELAPAHPNIPYNFGVVLFSLGEFRAARQQLLKVQSSAAATLYLARCDVEMGDYEEARSLADRADFSGVRGIRERYELSLLWAALDRPMDAEQVLRDLLLDFPDEAPARINLAVLLERANRIGEAESYLRQSTDRSSALYWITRAKLDAAGKRWEAALSALSQVGPILEAEPSHDGTAKLLSEMEFERGRALDKLRRYEEALTAFAKGNALIRDRFRTLHPARDSDGFRIDWLEDARHLDAVILAQTDVQTASDAAPDPVFLVGFPRSGTTLLDQILDAHPALQVLEEKPALEALVRVVGDLPAGYPSALGTLSEPQRQTLRRLYRDEVRRFLRPQPNTRLVDKYPFNLSRVHLVMRVFPRAQWIFAIRHPCDVVLSCFMQNFRFTDSTHGFWSIEQTASIYVQIMSLWLDQRERLRPDCLDVRYEDLVADVGREAQRLTDFLGLPWSDAMLRFNEHAKTRRIATPSYNQVVQPIYQTAQGRWQHYRPAFETALPMLRPLIERLGYPQPD